MQQADQTNIIIGPWAQPPQAPTPIQRLWESYQAAAAAKQHVYTLWLKADASGDDDQAERAEAECDKVYNILADVAAAILRSRPAAAIDLAIKARLVARREADLGGPCTAEEIQNFCRDVQIAASALEKKRR